MKRGVSKKKKPRDDLSSHRIREENVYSFQGTQVMGHDQSQEFKELLQYSETLNTQIDLFKTRKRSPGRSPGKKK